MLYTRCRPCNKPLPPTLLDRVSPYGPVNKGFSALAHTPFTNTCLAWPLRKDDTQNREVIPTFSEVEPAA